MPGIRKSRTMQAGLRSVPASRNAAAEANDSVRQPFECKTQLMASRMEMSSSTTVIRGTVDVIAVDKQGSKRYFYGHSKHSRVVLSIPLHLGLGRGDEPRSEG